MIGIGTSGFDYNDWVGFFYPEDLPKSEFLSYYSNHFDALELNFSYYRMPSAKQMESLLNRTYGKVEFSLKAHRSMTHDRIASKTDIALFNESIKPLRDAGKLSTVLAQFPHSFNQNENNRTYLKQLVDNIGLPLTVEFRKDEWLCSPITDWLKKIGVGYCCVDEPQIKGLMPPAAVATSSPAYVRFHGRNATKWYKHNQPHERYDYRYKASEIATWVPKIKQLEKEVEKVLVFFNNHFQAKAVDGAKTLKDLLLSM